MINSHRLLIIEVYINLGSRICYSSLLMFPSWMLPSTFELGITECEKLNGLELSLSLSTVSISIDLSGL